MFAPRKPCGNPSSFIHHLNIFSRGCQNACRKQNDPTLD